MLIIRSWGDMLSALPELNTGLIALVLMWEAGGLLFLFGNQRIISERHTLHLLCPFRIEPVDAFVIFLERSQLQLLNDRVVHSYEEAIRHEIIDR